MQEDGLAVLLEYCPNLRTLNVSQCKRLPARCIAVMAKACPQLEELDLTQCRIMNECPLSQLSSDHKLTFLR